MTITPQDAWKQVCKARSEKYQAYGFADCDVLTQHAIRRCKATSTTGYVRREDFIQAILVVIEEKKLGVKFDPIERPDVTTKNAKAAKTAMATLKDLLMG